ncbi:MAG: EAL domain-containing protein [Huintestinicola sp.]
MGIDNNNSRKRLTGRATFSLFLLIFLTACIVLGCAAFVIASVYPGYSGLILKTFCLFAGISSIIMIVAELIHNKLGIAREKEALELFTENINSMVILWDTSFEYVKVNDEFSKTLGYTSDELTDIENLKKVLPPEAFSENLQAIINNRDDEFVAQASTGKKVYTIWNTSLMASFGNTCIMMSIGSDLTEMVKMRQDLITYSEKLEESEGMFNLSMDLSEIGLLLKEDGTQRFCTSNQLREMLGLDSSDDYVGYNTIRERIHPRDRMIFDSFASKDAHDIADGEFHTVEFRALSSDESYHWYQFRYKTVDSTVQQFSIGGAVLDISREKEKDLIIERMAYIDEVTQIYNRNKFMMMGNEIVECRNGNPDIDYWIIVFDIDSFHIINDTCGYATGNKLLSRVASIITSSLTDGGFAARVGGDNFAVLIRADIDLGDDLPVNLIKHVQKELSQISDESLETQHITCSAGFCRMSDKEGDFASVLDRAEFALSLSEEARNNIIRYDNHAHDAIIEGNKIEKELAYAIENNELVLYYQPKISLETGRVIGMESLIRWIKPDGTLIPPSNFIPVAEHSMLITKISKFVLYEACRQNKYWQDIGLDPITVSINLSSIDFYQTNVTESIKQALKDTGLDPQWLDVELTETLALKDIDHAINQMNEIRDLGVKLSMDDFGTGYSSLSYIQVLPITLLKLDRSFIMYLEDDDISREIVSAVIRIAKSKNIETIAEGIETIGQAEILRSSGCDQAQGYFFGKPMPADQFEEFLRTRQSSAKVKI